MENEKLTTSQIFVITVFSILGVDVLVVPHNMVTLVDQDAWISLILGGLLLYIGAIPFLYLLNLYPDKDLPQIILQVAGKRKNFVCPLLYLLLCIPGCLPGFYLPKIFHTRHPYGLCNTGDCNACGV